MGRTTSCDGWQRWRLGGTCHAGRWRTPWPHPTRAAPPCLNSTLSPDPAPASEAAQAAGRRGADGERSGVGHMEEEAQAGVGVGRRQVARELELGTEAR